jgi:hypothetical protein
LSLRIVSPLVAIPPSCRPGPDGSGYPPGGAPCTSGYSSTGERFSVKLSLLWERIVARSHRRWMVHVGTRKPTGSLVAVQERSPTEQAVRTHEVALLDRRRWAMRALRHRCGFYPSRKERKEAAGLAGRGAVATTRRTGSPDRPPARSPESGLQPRTTVDRISRYGAQTRIPLMPGAPCEPGGKDFDVAVATVQEEVDRLFGSKVSSLTCCPRSPVLIEP